MVNTTPDSSLRQNNTNFVLIVKNRKGQEMITHITMRTLPSGKVMTTSTGQESFVRLDDFSQWPDTALNRIARDILNIGQTNANVVKFPRYRRQFRGEIEA